MSSQDNAFISCQSTIDFYIQGKDENQSRIESNVKDENQSRIDSNVQDGNLKVLPLTWKAITKQNLNLRYARVFSKSAADYIFRRLETEIEYFSGDLLKVKVFGKWHDIPRKQVSYGEAGLSYAFSGNQIPAVPWKKCPIVAELRDCVSNITGVEYNFVLINRYKNGEDHMGEHRDNEKELVADAPIASLSFGQNRDFIFTHKNSKGKQDDSLKLLLEHGTLLLMEWPTNKYWYHRLPIRKNAPNVRINLTFRKMLLK